MLLQSGERIDLDNEPQAVRRGIEQLTTLPRNPVHHVVDVPPLERRTQATAAQRPREGRRRLEGSNPIAEYNQRVNLLDWLIQAGGRIAQAFGDGGVLLHCPCPNHQHHDARPSLERRPARNRSRYGRFVAYGYAPECLFHTEQGEVMVAFNAYCKLEQVTPAEAVRRLRKHNV